MAVRAFVGFPRTGGALRGTAQTTREGVAAKVERTTAMYGGGSTSSGGLMGYDNRFNLHMRENDCGA
jgi:hypothetical protein